MMEKKYRVKLSAEEQAELKGLVSKGHVAAYSRLTPGSCCIAMKPRRAEGCRIRK